LCGLSNRKAALQKALDYSEVAKKADKSECYRASLSYYEAALEAYLSVLKSAPSLRGRALSLSLSLCRCD
jgi:hypothetical protein